MLLRKSISFNDGVASAIRLIENLKNVLPEIIERAAACDVSASFPREDVGLLWRIGVLNAFADAENGGLQLADRQIWLNCLFKCLQLIGGANLSLGRIVEGHINAIVLIERYGGPDMRAALASSLRNGALYGVWNTEPTPGVTLCLEKTGWKLNGVKNYATGCGQLDYAVITGRRTDDTKQMLVMALGNERQRADDSSWQTSGMRGTISGTYDFSDMRVPAEAILGEPGDYECEPMFTAGAWRFTAVQLGAIEALLMHLRDHLKRMKIDSDPIHRARFGRAVASTRTAYLWVREAAQRAEIHASEDAAPFVLMTRGVVEDAGLKVIETAQRSIGTKAFFTANPIDRILRDLALYLRQPAPDSALDRAAAAWLESDRWGDDSWW